MLYKYVPANSGGCTFKDVDCSTLISEIEVSNSSESKVIRPLCMLCVVQVTVFFLMT